MVTSVFRRSFPLPAFGVLQTVAFSLGLDDLTTVRQTVQRGPRQTLTAEHLGPILEGQVRSNDHALAFVRSRDHVEQEFCSGFARWNIPEFVQDQQVELSQEARSRKSERSSLASSSVVISSVTRQKRTRFPWRRRS